MDAPGIDAGDLVDTIDRVLAGMPDGAVLTVYTDDPTAPTAAVEWCDQRDVELLAIISHEAGGTTLALRRSNQPAGHPGTSPPRS